MLRGGAVRVNPEFEYYIHLAILICIYLILAQSLNLSFGLGGLFNLAHVAAYAVGAYATALLSVEYNVGFIGCIIASMAFAGLFSISLGLISMRLSSDYFAIGTIAFSAVISALLINWRSLTRGVLGIPGIPRPEILGIDFDDNSNFLLLTFFCLLVVLFILKICFNNSFSRALRAQGDFEHGAMAVGIATSWTRTISFIVSAIFAGLAGSLFAYYINFIDPTSFSLAEMVFILTIVVLGRPSSFWGCIAATIFLVLLPEPLRRFDLPAGILGPMRQMLYAIVLFLVVYIKRKELLPIKRTI